MNRTYVDGVLTRNSQKILKEQAKFYKKLNKANSEIKFMLTNNMDFKLTETMKTEFEEPITIDEVDTALKSLANNKMPGCDVLTASFF